MSSLPRLTASTRSSSNWCGVRCTGSPPTVTARFSRSTTRSPSSITGSPAGAGAAQHRAQPREQLVDADRLRDVVVGARVERGHLLALLADGREQDHRRLAPACAARGRRRCRCRPAARGRGSPRRAAASPPRRARPRPSRPCRPRSRRRAGSSAARAGSAARRRRRARAGRSRSDPHLGADRGQRRATNVAPWPARDSTATRPPFASAKPRAIASPRPAPAAPPLRVPRWNGSKISSRSSGGTPGPWSMTRTTASDGVAATLHAHRLAGRRVLQRVLDQVHEHAPDLARVDAHRRRVVGQRDLDAAAPRRRARRARRRRGRRAAQSSCSGGAAPACSRERSSRFPTRWSSRSDAARIVSSSSARSAASIARSCRASAPAEVEIAISGVRRSWLTAREQRGLHRVARGAAPRPRAPRARAARGRWRRRAATRAPAAAAAEPPRRAGRRPRARSCRRAVRPRRARSPLPSGAEHDRAPTRPAAPAPRRPRSARARRRPCRARAASPRSRRAATPRAPGGATAPPAPTTTTATTTKTASASQFFESVIVNVCTGVEEEPVEREHARRPRPRPRSASPQNDGDRQHREHVERPEAQHRDRTGAAPRSRASRARPRGRSRRRRSPGPAIDQRTERARVSRLLRTLAERDHAVDRAARARGDLRVDRRPRTASRAARRAPSRA